MEKDELSTVRTRNTLGIGIGAVWTAMFAGMTYLSGTKSLAENFFKGTTASEDFATTEMVTLRDNLRKSHEGEKGFFNKMKFQFSAVGQLSKKIKERNLSLKETFNNQSTLYKASSIISVLGLVVSATMLVKELIGRKEEATLIEEKSSEQLQADNENVVSSEEAKVLAENKQKLKAMGMANRFKINAKKRQPILLYAVLNPYVINTINHMFVDRFLTEPAVSYYAAFFAFVS